MVDFFKEKKIYLEHKLWVQVSNENAQSKSPRFDARKWNLKGV